MIYYNIVIVDIDGPSTFTMVAPNDLDIILSSWAPCRLDSIEALDINDYIFAELNEGGDILF